MNLLIKISDFWENFQMFTVYKIAFSLYKNSFSLFHSIYFDLKFILYEIRHLENSKILTEGSVI